MPDNYYHPDDPTRPSQAMPPSPGPYQDKLVLGSFQKPSRNPYQYPPQATSTSATDAGTYHQHYQTPKQLAPRRPRRRRGCLVGCLVVLLLACILGSITVTTSQRVLAFGSAISTQTPLSTQNNFMNTSERTNLLVISYGGGDHDGSLLTDSLLVVSMLPQNTHTSLISIPRDLTVQVPEGSGIYQKINTVYQVGSNAGKDHIAGGDAVAHKTSQITGLNVKNWMMIDFNGFRELIDAIGGIDVYVPAAFTANYPKNDNPNIDASWISVRFQKGNQQMDGETAIRYARARYVTDNLAEGTDFARSARQQIIVKALLAKVQQISTWPKLLDALNVLQKTIYTNMSLVDLGLFTRKMDLNDPKTARIGLSTANVLAEDANYNLYPQGSNYTIISDYVKKNLYN